MLFSVYAANCNGPSSAILTRSLQVLRPPLGRPHILDFIIPIWKGKRLPKMAGYQLAERNCESSRGFMSEWVFRMRWSVGGWLFEREKRYAGVYYFLFISEELKTKNFLEKNRWQCSSSSFVSSTSYSFWCKPDQCNYRSKALREVFIRYYRYYIIINESFDS